MTRRDSPYWPAAARLTTQHGDFTRHMLAAEVAGQVRARDPLGAAGAFCRNHVRTGAIERVQHGRKGEPARYRLAEPVWTVPIRWVSAAEIRERWPDA